MQFAFAIKQTFEHNKICRKVQQRMSNDVVYKDVITQDSSLYTNHAVYFFIH